MNENLLNVVRRIIEEKGDSALANPKLVSAIFADIARDEPKPQKNAFLKCIELGHAQMLKNAGEENRAEAMEKLAQQLHEEEGLDLKLCEETVTLLEAALFGKEKTKAETQNLCQKCMRTMQDDWDFCPYCGIQLKVPAGKLTISSNNTATVKPVSVSTGKSTTKKTTKKLEEDMVKRSAEVWICGRCNTANKFSRDFCQKCGKEFNPPLFLSNEKNNWKPSKLM
ncbi:MAG: zinc ribbon domain-containing protein [Treponema sp.]|nr:zinc ribbon domain-containing protein [Treponema sp.]